MIRTIRPGLALGIMAMAAGCGSGEPAPAASPKERVSASATASDACKTGEKRLPGSRLCESAALALMPSPEVIDEPGCRWVLAETGLPDDEWAVYRALACKTGTTRLQFAGGEQMAQLTLAESAFGGPVSSDPGPMRR